MPQPLRALLLLLASAPLFAACDDDGTGPGDGSDAIVLGANLELDGGRPEVGLSSRRAIELFLAERAEELLVGGEGRAVSLEVGDNGNDADGAADVARTLIEDEAALVIVGPNVSALAIAAGEVADDLETPMVSPWSTNPATTAGRSWVFRAPFIDSFQGPVLARFASEQYGGPRACVLYDRGEAYSTGIAEAFRDAWAAEHGEGSVAAYESVTRDDVDYGTQLADVRDADCAVLFAPLYAEEILILVPQAAEVGVEAPILGSDSWLSAGLVEACGDACDGIFVSAHYLPTGAVGDARAFIDLYEAEYGVVPDDVAALTWDAMLVVEQGLANCGALTGDLETDRRCLRDGIAAITGLDGVTGTLSYDGSGDPEKCVLIGEIREGEVVPEREVCP